MFYELSIYQGVLLRRDCLVVAADITMLEQVRFNCAFSSLTFCEAQKPAAFSVYKAAVADALRATTPPRRALLVLGCHFEEHFGEGAVALHDDGGFFGEGKVKC